MPTVIAVQLAICQPAWSAADAWEHCYTAYSNTEMSFSRAYLAMRIEQKPVDLEVNSRESPLVRTITPPMFFMSCVFLGVFFSFEPNAPRFALCKHKKEWGVVSTELFWRDRMNEMSSPQMTTAGRQRDVTFRNYYKWDEKWFFKISFRMPRQGECSLVNFLSAKKVCLCEISNIRPWVKKWKYLFPSKPSFSF